LDSRGDHRDLHGALDEAHEAYHDDQPRADYCDRVIQTYRYRNPHGYVAAAAMAPDPVRTATDTGTDMDTATDTGRTVITAVSDRGKSKE
jgi:hypothetical protein